MKSENWLEPSMSDVIFLDLEESKSASKCWYIFPALASVAMIGSYVSFAAGYREEGKYFACSIGAVAAGAGAAVCLKALRTSCVKTGRAACGVLKDSFRSFMKPEGVLINTVFAPLAPFWCCLPKAKPVQPQQQIQEFPENEGAMAHSMLDDVEVNL